jgi:hypothetical protein
VEPHGSERRRRVSIISVVAGCRDDAPMEKSEKDLLSGTVSALVDREHTTFPADAVVRDVLREIGRSNHLNGAKQRHVVKRY